MAVLSPARLAEGCRCGSPCVHGIPVLPAAKLVCCVCASPQGHPAEMLQGKSESIEGECSKKRKVSMERNPKGCGDFNGEQFSLTPSEGQRILAMVQQLCL